MHSTFTRLCGRCIPLVFRVTDQAVPAPLLRLSDTLLHLRTPVQGTVWHNVHVYAVHGVHTVSHCPSFKFCFILLKLVFALKFRPFHGLSIQVFELYFIVCTYILYPLLPSFLPSFLHSFLPSRIPSEQSVPPPTVILEGLGRSGRGGGEEDEDEEDSQFLVEDATPLDPPPTEAFLGGNEVDKPEGSLTLLHVHDSLEPVCPTFCLL